MSQSVHRLVWTAAMAVVAVAAGRAQQPTGTISGVVVDPSGAAVSGAVLEVVSADTGFERTLASAAGGGFVVSSLLTGKYRIEASARGFKRLVRDAEVAAGVNTTVNLQLEVGAGTETVTVTAATPQIDYESHAISGTVERDEIEQLPLNGRDFLDLAQLQPGVTVSPTSTSIHNQQFSVSIMGGDSDFTRVTVDGISIIDPVDGGTMHNFSQEVVQQFQIATASFDLSAGASASGAINIVTRTGGNDLHGGGYFFYRDHNMAAYPGLSFDPTDPDPFFARRQSGGTLSGPIVKNRLLFFYNMEHNNQTGVTDIQPTSAPLAHLGVIYPSPYDATQESARLDYRISDRNTLFLRYSHDGNHAFGLRGGASGLPSNWTQNNNWADQSVLGLTTTLGTGLVNEAHLAYTYWDTRNEPAGSECAGCLGAGGPEIDVSGGNFSIGNQDDAPQSVMERHYIWNDNLSWQHGRHQLRLGGEINHQHGTGYFDFTDPAQIELYSPEEVAGYNSQVPASRQIPIPASFNTLSDILALPLQSFAVGIGNASQPPPFQAGNAEYNTHFNLFATDTWRVNGALALSFGLGWTFDNNLLNFDLSKPAYLEPLLGAGGIGYPNNFYLNLSPSAGFAWSPDPGRHTVIRGGFGLYYDSALIENRLSERAYLGPVGNGRYPLPGTLVPNPIPGIPGVPTGTPLNFPTTPTYFTGGDLEAILPAVTDALSQELASFASPNSLTYRGINLFKESTDLYTKNFRPPESQHFNLGVERRLSAQWVLSVNGVWKHNIYGNMGNVDLNHFLSASGPVIPACTAAEALSLTAECSLDSIEFLIPESRSRYAAIMVEANRRLSDRFQMRASYTYRDGVGFNGVYDLNHLFSSWGEQLSHHQVLVSGVYRLPLGFHISLINTIASEGPFTATIDGIDLSGSGVSSSLLPGAPFGAFGNSMGRRDLARLVSAFNGTYAGTVDARGQAIPALTLPDHYGFGNPLIDQDARIGKSFAYRERLALDVFGECFNCLNIANLQGYSGNLTAPSSFGQPTSRITQVFGSGGPRAFQAAARLSF